MGAARTQYQIVGRYMDGKEITGYHLQSMESGKAGKYTKEQVCYLVGRDQVTNCSGQIYQDKVLLRGVGISLDSLPVQQEDGSLSRTENVGKVRRGSTGADVMTQFMLIGCITEGRYTVGYVIQNAGGGQTQISREQLINLAKQGKIGNARVQQYQGKMILKGVNCDLNQLPRCNASQM